MNKQISQRHLACFITEVWSYGLDAMNFIGFLGSWTILSYPWAFYPESKWRHWRLAVNYHENICSRRVIPTNDLKI